MFRSVHQLLWPAWREVTSCTDQRNKKTNIGQPLVLHTLFFPASRLDWSSGASTGVPSFAEAQGGNPATPCVFKQRRTSDRFPSAPAGLNCSSRGLRLSLRSRARRGEPPLARAQRN